MPTAGEYPTRFEWSRRGRLEPDAFGQRREEPQPLGQLWGVVEDVTAVRANEKETTRQRFAATVRLRNYPDVQPGDQLRDAGRGEVWTVDTAARGVNEVIADVGR